MTARKVVLNLATTATILFQIFHFGSAFFSAFIHSFIHLVAHLQLVAAADCAGALDVIDDLQNLLVSYGTCLA